MESDPQTGQTKGPATSDELAAWKRALATVKLRSFTATPDTVDAFAATTLAWNVDVADTEGVQLYLNGAPVDPIGSLTRVPIGDTVYTLAARLEAAHAALGAVTVRVDESELIPTRFTESDLASFSTQILPAVDSVMASIVPDLVTITVRQHHFQYRLTSKIAFTLFVQNEKLAASTVSLDTTAFTPPTIAGGVDAVLSLGLRAALNDAVAALPGGLLVFLTLIKKRVYSVEYQAGQITIAVA